MQNNITLTGKAKDIKTLLNTLAELYPTITVEDYIKLQQIKKEVSYMTNKKGGKYDR